MRLPRRVGTPAVASPAVLVFLGSATIIWMLCRTVGICPVHQPRPPACACIWFDDVTRRHSPGHMRPRLRLKQRALRLRMARKNIHVACTRSPSSAPCLNPPSCPCPPLCSTSTSSSACRGPPPPATAKVQPPSTACFFSKLNCKSLYYALAASGLVPINYYVRIATGCCTIAYTCIALYPLVPRRIQIKPFFSFLIASFPRLMSAPPPAPVITLITVLTPPPQSIRLPPRCSVCRPALGSQSAAPRPPCII